MTALANSRQRVLDRIRTATQSVAKDPGSLASAYAELPHSYVRHGSLSTEARLDLMIERLREYDAEVVETTPQELPATIAAQLAASGKTGTPQASTGRPTAA